MKEKKKSAVSWILTWAGQKRIAYVWSVLLAIGNVIFKILPYFIIADVVKLFLNGEKEFEICLSHNQEVPAPACHSRLFLYLQVLQTLLYVTMLSKVNEAVLQ